MRLDVTWSAFSFSNQEGLSRQVVSYVCVSEQASCVFDTHPNLATLTHVKFLF